MSRRIVIDVRPDSVVITVTTGPTGNGHRLQTFEIENGETTTAEQTAIEVVRDSIREVFGP